MVPGQTAAAVVQIAPADSSGVLNSLTPLGTATLTLAGAASSEVLLVPGSLPVVFPSRSAAVIFHHVHDTRANLVPDGAVFGASVTNCATRFDNGQCVSSAGGSLLDGAVSPGGLRLYTLSGAQLRTTVSISSSATKPFGQACWQTAFARDRCLGSCPRTPASIGALGCRANGTPTSPPASCSSIAPS